jgi:hypothetical protein
MMSYYPRSAIATVLSVSISLEAVAISTEYLRWSPPQDRSLCANPEAVLPHTEFPEHAPLLVPNIAMIAVTASTGSTQVPMYV